MSSGSKIVTPLVEKEFAKEFVANGMNGTQAIMKVKGKAHRSLRGAGVDASRMLAKPSVQQHIKDLLPKDEVTAKIIADVYNSKREEQISYRDLHKFLETDLKLKGYLSTTEKSSGINVAFIINNNTKGDTKNT